MNDDVRMIQQGFGMMGDVAQVRQQELEKNRPLSPLEKWIADHVAQGFTPQDLAIGVKGGVLQMPQGSASPTAAPAPSGLSGGAPPPMSPRDRIEGAFQGQPIAYPETTLGGLSGRPAPTAPPRQASGPMMSGPASPMTPASRGYPGVQTRQDYNALMAAGELQGKMQPRRRPLEEELMIQGLRNSGRMDAVNAQQAGATARNDARVGLGQDQLAQRAYEFDVKGEQFQQKMAQTYMLTQQKLAAAMDRVKAGASARDALMQSQMDIRDLTSVRAMVANLARARAQSYGNDEEINAQFEAMSDLERQMTQMFNNTRQSEGGRQGFTPRAGAPTGAAPSGAPRRQRVRSADGKMGWWDGVSPLPPGVTVVPGG